MTPPLILHYDGLPARIRTGRAYLSGPVIRAEVAGDVEVTLRLPEPEFTFDGAAHEIALVEGFEAGEERFVTFEWALEWDYETRARHTLLEIDVRYLDEDELHTAVIAIELEDGSSARRAALGAAFVGALAGAAMALWRRPAAEEPPPAQKKRRPKKPAGASSSKKRRTKK